MEVSTTTGLLRPTGEPEDAAGSTPQGAVQEGAPAEECPASPTTPHSQVRFQIAPIERPNRKQGRTTSSSSNRSASPDAESLTLERKVPDGGWGWMVVAAAFTVNMIADGVCFSFGLFFVEFLRVFGASKSATSWLGSIFLALPLMLGPVASSLVDRFGCRRTTIAGALISFVGFALSYFVNSFPLLFITFSIMPGIGLSVCYVSAVVIVAYYFERRRSLATGISVCGTGVGTFLFAPLVEFLIQEYSWRGAVLVLSGIFLNMVVCGMIMRDLSWTKHKYRERSSQGTLSGERDSSSGDSGDSLPDIEQLKQALQSGVPWPLDQSEQELDRLHSSDLQLPTWIADTSVPPQVYERIKTDHRLYEMVVRLYPHLLPSCEDVHANGGAENGDLRSRLCGDTKPGGDVTTPGDGIGVPTDPTQTRGGCEDKGQSGWRVEDDCRCPLMTSTPALGLTSIGRELNFEYADDVSRCDCTRCKVCSGNGTGDLNGGLTSSFSSSSLSDTFGCSNRGRLDQRTREPNGDISVNHSRIPENASNGVDKGVDKERCTVHPPFHIRSGEYIDRKSIKDNGTVDQKCNSNNDVVSSSLRLNKLAVSACCSFAFVGEPTDASDKVKTGLSSGNDYYAKHNPDRNNTKPPSSDHATCRCNGWNQFRSNGCNSPPHAATESRTSSSALNVNDLCNNSQDALQQREEGEMPAPGEDERTVPGAETAAAAADRPLCLCLKPLSAAPLVGRREEAGAAACHVLSETTPKLEGGATQARGCRSVPAQPGRLLPLPFISCESEPSAAYLRNIRLRRQSMTYRGAMLHISRYRLKTSSCPDIYRNSMITILSEDDDESCWSCLTDMLLSLRRMVDITYFKLPAFTLFALSNFVLYMFYDVPYVYLADHAIAEGVAADQASVLISVIGASNVVGMLLIGYVGDKPNVNSTALYVACMLGCGVGTLLVPSCSSYRSMLALSAVFGFCVSANYTLAPTILVDLITIENFTNAYGLLLLIQGLANLIGPPLCGLLHDRTGNYDLTFHAAGVAIITSGLLLCLLQLAKASRRAIRTVRSSEAFPSRL